MLRAVITPQQPDISIHVPDNFVGKQVEVIVFAIDEPVTDKPLTYFASEQVLAKDWLTDEEDNTWRDL